MIPLKPESLRRVLCVGAHCDDIEIGCGGTLLQLQKHNPAVVIDWVLVTGEQSRQAGTTAAWERFVRPASRGRLRFGDFPDTSLPAEYARLKQFFAQVARSSSPDLVFCHTRGDAHQDHRMVNEMAWGAFRNHLVLEYEIPKWDGDLGIPNTYVPLDEDVLATKIDALMAIYGSQRSKDWFTPDTFRSLARIRGIECRAPSGHAEAFTARKINLSWTGERP